MILVSIKQPVDAGTGAGDLFSLQRWREILTSGAPKALCIEELEGNPGSMSCSQFVHVA